MKKYLIILFIAFASSGMTQDSVEYTWKSKFTFDIDSSSVWSIDRLENHYVFNGNTIEKIDSIGTVRFTQSVRSYGQMSSLEPINTMKLVYFSQEQQTVCFFDNTLTPYQDCIELIEADIVNASFICSSSQSDRIWVLDQLNSTLSQLVFSGSRPGVSVENLAGIISIDEVTQMIERNEHLFLLDKHRGVYEFDLYGSLIDFHPKKNVIQIEVMEKALVLLINNVLVLQSTKIDESLEIALPVDDVFEFKIINNAIFLRTPKTVHKFELQFKQ